MRKSIIEFFIISAWALASLILSSCASSDDDAGAGSEIAMTDDSSIDDTAGDDLPGDDSLDDAGDDAGDDDTSEPTRLLVIGDDGSGAMSWLQSASGWTKYPIPRPPSSENLLMELGPVFFLDGQKGYSAWNSHLVITYLWFELTLGHKWLVFDPSTGWSFDDVRAPACPLTEVKHLFIPGGQSYWVAAHFYYTYYLDGTNLEALFRYSGSDPHMSLFSDNITSMFFPSENAGLVASDESGEGQVKRFTGTGWLPWNYPSLFQSGTFLWLWLEDMENGFLIWNDGSTYSIVQLDQSTFEIVTAPIGCENLPFRALFAQGGHAVAIEGEDDFFLLNDRFLELRDGTWYCRNLGSADSLTTPVHALVLKDGREFIAATPHTGNGLLFQITADDVIPVALPVDLITIRSVHAIGPQAPKYSLRPLLYYSE